MKKWPVMNYFTILFALLFIFAGIKGFIELTDDYYENDLTGLDVFVSQHIWELRSAPLTVLMKCITYMGEDVSYLILFGILFIYAKRTHKMYLLLRTIIVVLISTAISFIIKELVERPRPLNEALINVTSHSFPSGHAMSAVAFYGSLTFIAFYYGLQYRWKVLTIAVVMILLMGISRIYLGVHYASDVLAGYAGGLSVIGIAALIFEVWKTFVNRPSIPS